MTAADVVAIQFPEVSRKSLLLQRFFPPHATVDFEWHNTPVRIHFSASAPVAPLPFILSLAVNGWPIEMCVDERWLSALTEALAPGLAFETLPDLIALAIIQSASLPVVQHLEETLGLQIQLTSFSGDQPVKDDVTALALTFDFGGHPFWSVLNLSDEVLDLLIAAPLNFSPQKRGLPSAIRNIPVRTGVVLHGPELLLSDLKCLQQGDVVLLHLDSDLLSPGASLPVEMTVSGVSLFTAELSGNDLTITGFSEGETMAYNSDYQDDSQDSAMGNVPLQVTFEIAKREQTIEQLCDISPGQIYALDKPLQSLVTLRVNGKAIAEAELVTINDRVGARITRVLQNLDEAGEEGIDQ